MKNGFVDENAPSPVSSPVEEITGDGVAAVQPNPLQQEGQPAEPEEQAAYEDLLKRAVSMVHDTRGPEPISDKIIKALSNDQVPAYQTIGKQAGTILQLLYENAKRQKVQYPPSVLREVGLDLVTELIMLAREVGAVKNLPPEDSQEEAKFAELASLEGSKWFGDYLMKTGQANPEDYQQEMMSQMEREASSGALDDWNIKEMMPEEAYNQGVAQIRGFENGT